MHVVDATVHVTKWYITPYRWKRKTGNRCWLAAFAKFIAKFLKQCKIMPTDRIQNARKRTESKSNLNNKLMRRSFITLQSPPNEINTLQLWKMELSDRINCVKLYQNYFSRPWSRIDGNARNILLRLGLFCFRDHCHIFWNKWFNLKFTQVFSAHYHP